MKKLIVLVVLLAGCGYAGSQGYGWWNDAVYQPMASQSQPVRISVSQGESPAHGVCDLALGEPPKAGFDNLDRVCGRKELGDI